MACNADHVWQYWWRNFLLNLTIRDPHTHISDKTNCRPILSGATLPLTSPRFPAVCLEDLHMYISSILSKKNIHCLAAHFWSGAAQKYWVWGRLGRDGQASEPTALLSTLQWLGLLCLLHRWGTGGRGGEGVFSIPAYSISWRLVAGNKIFNILW
jgi:hypothetical protein